MTVIAVRGPWRAAVLGSVDRCRFEPVASLSDADSAFLPGLAESRSALAELRRAGGGIMPWALLGATYEPDPGVSVRYEVPHSGSLASSQSACEGLLGRELKAGLPIEFAQAALDGLTRHDPSRNRPGLLTVVAAGYDEVDSSAYIFERAAGLLKWVLLSEVREGLTTSDVSAFLEQLDALK